MKTKKSIVITLSLALVAALGATADVPYRLGIAGWSFCEEKLDKGLEICQKVQCKYLCHKDFFLPYDADAQAIADYKAKLAKFGVKAETKGAIGGLLSGCSIYGSGIGATM